MHSAWPRSSWSRLGLFTRVRANLHAVSLIGVDCALPSDAVAVHDTTSQALTVMTCVLDSLMVVKGLRQTLFSMRRIACGPSTSPRAELGTLPPCYRPAPRNGPSLVDRLAGTRKRKPVSHDRKSSSVLVYIKPSLECVYICTCPFGRVGGRCPSVPLSCVCLASRGPCARRREARGRDTHSSSGEERLR